MYSEMGNNVHKPNIYQIMATYDAKQVGLGLDIGIALIEITYFSLYRSVNIVYAVCLQIFMCLVIYMLKLYSMPI